jgi:hypothetical protein
MAQSEWTLYSNNEYTDFRRSTLSNQNLYLKTGVRQPPCWVVIGLISCQNEKEQKR